MKKYYLTLFFLLGFSSFAHAFSVEHNFKVELGVFDASRTKFTYEILPQSYNVHSVVKTNGFFDTVYPFKAHYATTGKISGKKIVTTSYKYNSETRFSQRTRELIYDQNGNPIYRINTKNNKTKKRKIEQQKKNEGTTDLQTVIAKLALQYNRTKKCAARMEVFDGKRRFATIFKDEGKEDLPKSEFSPFSGKAHKCSMYIDRLASEGDDLLWELTSEQPVNFWILQDSKTNIPFIAKIEIENTPLGKMDVYTQSIKIKE